MAGKPLKHVLVPEHTLVPSEEAAAVMKKLNLDKDKMPCIHKNDPAIAHLKAKPGDLIRIKRTSPTAGRTIYYRIVI
jgi:DNA-directed RNA polymerase subunit H (RpoH/RPB5)